MDSKDEHQGAPPAEQTRLRNNDRETVQRARDVEGIKTTKDAATRVLQPHADQTLVQNTRVRNDTPQATPTQARVVDEQIVDEQTIARGKNSEHTVPSVKQKVTAESSSSSKATVINPDRPSISKSQSPTSVSKPAAQYPGKKILKQRFVLMEMLGAGGMGNVYLAKDLLREEMEDSNPHIAIKVLNDECRRMPGALQSLQREAKKAQALSHPNIVTVYDFDRDGETAFITMEYINGQELKQYLRGSKRMPHAKAMYVIERVARGLAYAHQQGFAHSDIKPANIFLGKDETVRILDFGIAKAFTEATKEKRSLADDLIEGALTPAYASLEMLQGQSAIPSDDVYSLACMAYEMIQGRHPFIGDDGRPMPADVAKATGAKVEPIQGIPRRHMRALRKGLEFERADRFNDAGEFIDAIKSRNLKRDFTMLAIAVTLAGVGFFAMDYGLQQVVPSLTSLKPELVKVVQMINEGDEFLALEDVSTANRLYAEAWEEANYVTVADAEEREKAHAILQDRMNKLSRALIARSKADDIDEYQLRELAVALDFLLRGEQTSNENQIKKALARINKRIDRIGQASN